MKLVYLYIYIYSNFLHVSTYGMVISREVKQWMDIYMHLFVSKVANIEG